MSILMSECPSGKLTYTSPAEAVRAARSIQKRRRRRMLQAHYRCRWCRAWHLTKPG